MSKDLGAGTRVVTSMQADDIVVIDANAYGNGQWTAFTRLMGMEREVPMRRYGVVDEDRHPRDMSGAVKFKGAFTVTSKGVLRFETEVSASNGNNEDERARNTHGRSSGGYKPESNGFEFLHKVLITRIIA